MAQSTRDNNQITAKLGSFNGVSTPLKIEHATGYLKAKIVRTTLSAPSVSPAVAARDSNQVASTLGSYNDTPKPLLATNRRQR